MKETLMLQVLKDMNVRKTLLIIALFALLFTAGTYLAGTTAANAAMGCPEGYVDCHGVCVPYPCPN